MLTVALILSGVFGLVALAPAAAAAPPTVPGTPSGPTQLNVAQSGTYCATATDPDGNMIQYVFNWGDGSPVSVTGFTTSGVQGCMSHAWNVQGTYCVTVYSQDTIEPIAGVSAPRAVRIGAPGNGAPCIPQPPSGPTSLSANQSGTYCATSTDPDGNTIQYVFKWGDGSPVSVTGHTTSGQQGCMSHAWASGGSFCVSVYAQDTIVAIRGESGCTTVSVTSPNQPPTARYTHTVNGLTVNFDGRTSSDPNNNINQYRWDWGDGSGPSFGSVVSHTFPCVGPYWVALTVTDTGGLSDFEEKQISPTQATDNDGDGLIACREGQQGTSDGDRDSDNDGLNDFVESQWWPSRQSVFCNAAGTTCEHPSPAQRDLYVEVDWYQGNAWQAGATTQIRNAITNAGSDVLVHIDSGQLGGGGTNLGANGNVDGPTAMNNRGASLRAGRDAYFHYLVVGCSPPGNGYYGIAETPGNDAAIYNCMNDSPTDSLATYQAKEFFHEVGHNYLGYYVDIARCATPDYTLRHNPSLSHFDQAENFAANPYYDCNRDGRQDAWSHSTNRNDNMHIGGPTGKDTVGYVAATWSAIRLDWSIDGTVPDCKPILPVSALATLGLSPCLADMEAHAHSHMHEGQPASSGAPAGVDVLAALAGLGAVVGMTRWTRRL